MIIRFSHLYEKMPPDFKVSRLMDVEVIQLENLSGKFLDDDTRIVGGEYYPLPRKGKYMILRLESSIMNIRWQTIRRWTSSKESYYRRYVGKLLDCVVE
jgi:hypothetical protein